MKPCKKCGGSDRNPSGGCRPCSKAYHQKYRNENRERVRAYGQKYAAVNSGKAKTYRKRYYAANAERAKAYSKANALKQKYGLTLQQWDLLLISQLGRCWFCERSMLETPVVDHDHATKEVRGLAHRNCNIAFGLLAEDPEVLQLLAQKAVSLHHKPLQMLTSF